MTELNRINPVCVSEWFPVAPFRSLRGDDSDGARVCSSERRPSATTHLYNPPVTATVNRRRLLALSACVAVVALGTGVSLGSAAGATSDSPLAQQDIDTDDVSLSITVEVDGDANWTIEYRTRLETDDDDAAFEELRSDVEADPAPYAERFGDRINGTAASAENATGRDMTITEMSVSADKRELPQEYGVLRYEFRWSNFAAVEGDRLIVGDAIGGLFLDAESSLLISWPGTHELIDASPQPSETRNGSVVYAGPTDFAGEEPRIELGSQGATTPTADAGATGRWFPFGIAVVVLALVVAVGAFVIYRRRDGSADEPTGGGGGEGEPSGAGGGAGGQPDAELLSNGEQVLQLIESEGGRMKQQAVAERLGWTDAKTSQVTKTLREDGDLEGFRLGRENVLSLPGDGDSGGE